MDEPSQEQQSPDRLQPLLGLSCARTGEVWKIWGWDREGTCTEGGRSLQRLVIPSHGILGCRAGPESRGAWEGVKFVLPFKKPGGGGRCWL